jgi:predicted ATPase/DNA-binding SARP family transcriptional activator
MPPSVRRGTGSRPTIRIVGPVRLELDGEPVAVRPAQRRLLAILALAGDSEVDVETLIDRMWGDDPPRTARTTLHVYISSLRRSIPDAIATTPLGYRLTRRPSDLVELERAIQDADRAAQLADWTTVLNATGRPLGDGGTPYADVASEVWAMAAVQRIEGIRARLVDRRIEALLGLDRHGEAAELARRELGRDPLEERRWEQLVVALLRAGRTTDALRAFRTADQTIRSELGVPPGPALRDLEHRIRLDDETFRDPDAPAGHGLPDARTTFVGRAEDLLDLDQAVPALGSVTIVGPPGVGKSRLAIEHARLNLDRYPDGAWFCALGAATSDADVMSIVTAATQTRHQVSSIEELARRLAARRALVILDDCERVIEPCKALVEGILGEAGPGRVVATSRRPLGLVGETIWSVAPLALPSAGPRSSPVEEDLASPAIQLFGDRARAADPSFRLTARALPVAVEVCRSAGGIPLAIELAASWLPAIGVADLYDILGPDLTWRSEAALGDAHDASLRSAMDRSIALLIDIDRVLLSALAVFRGPFSLADVLAVCTPGATLRDVAGGVARLADASLVVFERRAAGRAVYRLLTPIREYLVATDPGPADDVRRAFTDHYLKKARRWCPDPLQTGGDLLQMDDDIDNVRAALEIGLDARHEDAGHAIRALQGYFYDRYLQWEGIRWLERALAVVDDEVLRAWLLRALGSAAHNTNDIDGAARYLAEALRDFRRLGHTDGMALSLLSIAQVHATRGSWTACRRDARRARRLLGPRGNRSGLAVAAYYIGESLACEDEIGRALPSLARAARLFEETEQPHRAAYALSTLVMSAVLGGMEKEARLHAPRAIELARRSASGYRLTRALSAASAVEAVWGDDETAYRLLLEARRYLGPLITDVVIEFALPAGFLVRRHESWRLLVELLAQSETAAAQSVVSLTIPWQRQIRRWHTEAEAHGVPAVPGVRSDVPVDGPRLAEATLEALLPGSDG